MLDHTTPAAADTVAGLNSAVAAEPPSGIVETFNYARGKPGVIPLWVGEGHLPTPDFICDAAIASLKAGETFYTWQRGLPELRQALADYHGRLYRLKTDPENFFVCQSGMQSVQLALQATLAAGDEIIVPSPAWPNYAAPLRMMNVRPVEVVMEFAAAGWRLDLDRLFAAATPRTKAILVNTPSNPLGRVMPAAEIIAIRDFARQHGLWLIADEVYARYFYSPRGALPPSFLEQCDPDERIIFCNTFSKNWAMTGWRLGWLIAPKRMGQMIENLVQYNTSGTTTFLQRGCIAALEQGEAFLEGQIERAARGRDIMCDALASAPGVEFARPDGAFYLFFRIDGGGDSTALSRRLIDETGVGCAPGSAFGPGGDGFLRLCFARGEEDLTEAADRLVGWLKAR